MAFETFKIFYLTVSILSALVVCWKLRKNRDDLVFVLMMSLVMMALFVANYLDSKEHVLTNDILEFLFRALTHVQGDILLTFCNVLCWGTVPFAIGIMARNNRYGKWLVWIVMALFATLKTFFEDFFFIHRYPQGAFHSFEWNYVLVAWAGIYSLAAFFIIKGREFINAANEDGKTPNNKLGV